MKNLIILLLSIVFFSCSNQKFVKTVKKDKNLKEIIDFKEYLLKKNIMENFKENKVISSTNDPIIKNFFSKYNITAMHIITCGNYNYVSPDSHFKKCGNIIELYSGIPLISTEHALIFDYSEEYLNLKEGLSEKKYKIADRIFVF